MSSQLIIITGFMGSGKSTVAHVLARLLNCRAIDLDRVITKREKRTPKEIIEQDGEPAFRQIETGRLREALEVDSARVIALGGGAWTVQRNRDLIAQAEGFTIWLDVPFELCWQRIVAAGNERPLAPDEEQARRLYQKRRPQYELAALHLPAHGTTSVDELAATIVRAVDFGE